jgi:hypothetical protein
MGIFRRFLSGRGSGDFSVWAGGSPAATIFEAPGMVAANKPPVAARNCLRSIAKLFGAKFFGGKFFGAESLGAESFGRFFKRVSLEKRSKVGGNVSGALYDVRGANKQENRFCMVGHSPSCQRFGTYADPHLLCIRAHGDAPS